jgi:hypothetical protein
MKPTTTKFQWPRVVIPTTPEVQRLNALIFSFDVFTGYAYDGCGDLHALADAAQNNRQFVIETELRQQIIRQNAPCRTQGQN